MDKINDVRTILLLDNLDNDTLFYLLTQISDSLSFSRCMHDAINNRLDSGYDAFRTSVIYHIDKYYSYEHVSFRVNKMKMFIKC